MKLITDFISGKYHFLSNFFPGSPIWFDGHWYETVEHAFQAAKTYSRSERNFVRAGGSPKRAHQMARYIQPYAGWTEMCLPIMLDLLRQKFSGRKIGRLLLNTGNAWLIYGTRSNTYWGCVYRDNRWLGENHLGSLLMVVRDELTQR